MGEPQPESVQPAIPLFARMKFGLIRRLFQAVLLVLGPTGLYHLARAFGYCEWAVNYKRRHRFHQQMNVIFGHGYQPRSMRHACRRYFVRTRCDKLFYLIFDLLTDEQIRQRIHIVNRESFDRSVDRGKGLYVALAHFGTQHTSGLLMRFLGYDVAGVRDRDEGALRRYIQQRLNSRFSQFRTATIFYADAFPRDLYRWFKKNGILGSALDAERVRDQRLKRVKVELFGQTKEYLTGTLQIALRCRAAIHQGFIISKPGFHYELHATDTLADPDHQQDNPECVQHIMQTYARNLEAYLRKYPDHVSRI